MWGACGSLGGMLPDASGDDVRLSENRLVRKPQDDETLGAKPGVPDVVLCFTQDMNAAIRLDDEFDGRTAEVGDMGPERHLSPEAQAIDPTVADERPQRLLGPCRLLALATS